MSHYKKHRGFEDVLVNVNGWKRVDSGEEYDYGDGRTFVPTGLNHQRTFMRIDFVEGGYDIVPITRDTVNEIGIPGRRAKASHEYPASCPQEVING